MQRAQPHPRLGIASIAGRLRAGGANVSLFDPELDKMSASAVAESVVRAKAQYVGLPAHTEEVHDAAAIAREIKRRDPDIVSVIGGYHVSALPRETLAEFAEFDAGIVGEGEQPFQELVSGAPRETIQGLAFRDAHGTTVVNPARDMYPPLDELPPPAWDLYRLPAYPRGLPIELLRSCPFTCSFCFKATGRKPRYKSLPRLFHEIETCMKTHGARDFFFVSSGTFPVKRSHGLEVCHGILERGWKIRWYTSTRVDLVDEELLSAMKAAGCSGINFGIESGDPGVLEHCRKGVSLEQAERAVRLCHAVGIPTELNFILGLPYESRESLRNTLRFARRLRPWSTLANFAILVPFPGTAVYDMALRGEGGLRI